MSIFKNITPDQFPKEYTQHCGGKPKSIDDIVRIKRNAVSGLYDLTDKLYACWCWAYFQPTSLVKISAKLGISPQTLRPWLYEYAKDEVNKWVIGKSVKDNNVDGVTEKQVEALMSRVIRHANRKIKGAGFSQLLVGFGILHDKLKQMRAQPKESDTSAFEALLSGLPREAIEEISSIIDKYSNQGISSENITQKEESGGVGDVPHMATDSADAIGSERE